MIEAKNNLRADEAVRVLTKSPAMKSIAAPRARAAKKYHGEAYPKSPGRRETASRAAA